jgi:hypothetical protein
MCSPISKHTGTLGFSALAQVMYVQCGSAFSNAIVNSYAPVRGDEHLKSAAVIPDMMADPTWCMSEDFTKAPTARAHGIDGTFWDLLSAPGNEARQARFDAAMVTYSRFFPPNLILQCGPSYHYADSILMLSFRKHLCGARFLMKAWS